MLFEYDIPWSNSGIQWYISISKFHILVSLTFTSNRFLKEPFILFPNIHYQNSHHTPTLISTCNGDQDAQRQADSFLKGSISYLSSPKFRIITKKLQHGYKHILKLFSEKQRTFFSWRPQNCSKSYSVLFHSPFSLRSMFFFLLPHLVTLRLFLLYDP